MVLGYRFFPPVINAAFFEGNLFLGIGLDAIGLLKGANVGCICHTKLNRLRGRRVLACSPKQQFSQSQVNTCLRTMLPV